MHRLVIGLAAIGVLLTAVPAFSQVEVEVGRRGVGVEVERRDSDFRRDDFRHDRGVEVRRVFRNLQASSQAPLRNDTSRPG